MYQKKSLEYYFASTGFYDLLPLAFKLTQDAGYTQEEMIEAICKVADKAKMYPPVKNREAWFSIVFKEKLKETRAEILALRS